MINAVILRIKLLHTVASLYMGARIGSRHLMYAAYQQLGHLWAPRQRACP